MGIEQAKTPGRDLAAADIHILPHVERMLPILGITSERVCEKVLDLWAHQHGRKSGWKYKRKWKLGRRDKLGDSRFVYERRCRQGIRPNPGVIGSLYARFRSETKVQLGVEFHIDGCRNQATVHLFDEKPINGQALPKKG